jgi:predicted dehydrogenase
VTSVGTGHCIGVVGCGGIAHRHMAGYRLVAGELGRVVAACDPDRATLDAFCDRHGIERRFTDARELIASGEVDVLSLLTPPAVREQIVYPAIERGIHLLVEKPFAESYADARSFVEAGERAGVTLAVHQQQRFMGDVQLARELLAAGRLGEPRLVVNDQMQDRTRTRGWRTEETRLEISIFSIHLLDRVRFLVGRPPEAVSAVTRRWSDDVAGETFTALTIQFQGGAVGSVVSNWHAPTIPECRLRVDATAGSLLSVKREVLADDCTITIAPVGQEPETRELHEPDAFARCMGKSMRALLTAIDTGTPAPHSGRDNLATMAIVDGAYLSASRAGSRVDLAEITEGVGVR